MNLKLFLIAFLFFGTSFPLPNSIPNYVGVDDDVEIIWKVTKNATQIGNWTENGGNSYYNLSRYISLNKLLRIETTLLSDEQPVGNTDQIDETNQSYTVQYGAVFFDVSYGIVENHSSAIWTYIDPDIMAIFDDEDTDDEYIALKIWYNKFFYPILISTNLNMINIADALENHLDGLTKTIDVNVNIYNDGIYDNINTTINYNGLAGNFTYNLAWDDDGILHHLNLLYNDTSMISLRLVYFNDFERDSQNKNLDDEETPENEDFAEIKKFFYLIGGLAIIIAVLYISIIQYRKAKKH
jgi:hypothetical protein